MTAKVALIQMLVKPGAKEENLSRALRFVGEAADKGADIVLLPEALTLGWTDPSARSQADEIPGSKTYQCFAEAASAHRIHLCAGIIERAGERIFNSAFFIDDKGTLLLHHRKINELEIAHDLYGLGNVIQVASTRFGKIGLMICADGFACGQVISRSLGYLGAQLIVSPCAWAVPADHDQARNPYGKIWLDNYTPVARDFSLWIAAVSNVGPIQSGPWKGLKCIGNSLLIDPLGQIKVKGPYGENAETIIYAEIDLASPPARGEGWRRIWSGER
jgi:predicted amidohydrolase